MVILRDMRPKAAGILGRNIEAARKFKGVDQTGLGHIVGITQSAMSKLENRRDNGDLDKLVLIANALDVTLNDLARGIDASYDQRVSSDQSRHTMRLKPVSGGSHGVVGDTARLLQQQKKNAQMLGAISEAAGRIVGLVTALSEGADADRGQAGGGKTTRKVR